MSIQDLQFGSNKKTVNDAIKICVNCGNITVNIQNHRILCNDCGSFFDVVKKHDE